MAEKADVSGTAHVETPTATQATGVDPSNKQLHNVSRLERSLSERRGSLTKDGVDYSRIDPEVAKYATAEHIVISDQENKRLRWMINKRVLPIMVFTYFLQALDKGTLSFAAIMGIRDDLKIDGQQYSWLTTCIYIAILIVEYPINWLIQRVPLGKTLGSAIIIWGSILALHATSTKFSHMVTVRTLLGIFEAFCQPSFLIMSSMWYRRGEQAQIVTFWYMMNGVQQIVGGILSYCFSLIPEGRALKSWQALFITYGCFSVLWGVFVLFWLPDSPMKAKCFSEEDKTLMVERVRSNQTGLQNREFRIEHVKEAFRDPQIYCYMLIQICTTLPTSGLGAYVQIVINGFGFTTLQTQLLAMVLGAYLIIVMLSSMWMVKKTGKNLLVMGVYMIPSFVGTIVLMTVDNTSTATEAGLMIGYYITLSFWAAQTLAMSLLSRNVGGQTKKSVAVACNFVAWAAGNAAGPQVFLEWDEPRYFVAFATHMGCYCLCVVTIVFLWWYLRHENKRRDRMAAEGIVEADPAHDAHAWDDLTDKQNLSFRYVY